MSEKNTRFVPGETLSGKIVLIYTVLISTDGEGGSMESSYHATKQEAVTGSKGAGPQYRNDEGAFEHEDGTVHDRLALALPNGDYLILGEPVWLVDTTAEREKLRQQALGKLSPAERQVLGLVQ